MQNNKPVKLAMFDSLAARVASSMRPCKGVIQKHSKLLIIAVFLLAGCGVSDCEKDSETAIYARSLTEDRLDLLFKYSETLGAETQIEYYFDGTTLPEEISDLPIKLLKVDKRKVLFRLEGCLDHHLDLVVVRTGDNSPRIELRSGEAPRVKEVLWAK